MFNELVVTIATEYCNYGLDLKKVENSAPIFHTFVKDICIIKINLVEEN